jgi:glycine cleavage system aminomethyltransferase T
MIDLSAGHDFIGRAALERIAAGDRRGGAWASFSTARRWRATRSRFLRQNGRAVGHVSEIAHSRRMDANIGVGLAPAQLPDDATGLTVTLPEGDRAARLAPLPFAI